MTLRLAGFAGDSIVDGPGIRFTTFCQGCPHHCPGCQNPETWPFEGGFEVTPEDVVEHVKRNPLTRGVTFSGGEPFAQAAAHAELARQLKAAGEDKRRELDYHKAILNRELPYTIGGGIGQSRLCMYFLKKAHIGEVQVSVWPDDMLEKCRENGINIL